MSQWHAKEQLPIGAVAEGPLDSLSLGDRDAEFLDLFLEHSLLVFRDQKLTHEQQVAVMSCLGPVPDQVPTSVLSTTGVLGAGELVFHSDLSFDPHPHLAASLHALEIDPVGGTSTDFVDCAAAYEMLDPETKSQVDGLYALHVFPLATTERNVGARGEHYPRAVHPLAWANPRTGRKAIYVNSQATVGIVGLEPADSDQMISNLFKILYEESPRYSHAWHPGDLVIWDNRSLQHSRGSQVHMKSRVLQRVVSDYLTFEARYGAFLESDAVSLRKDPALQGVGTS